MRLLWRLTFFVLAIAAINTATYVLLKSNLSAGPYNVQADSIGIPPTAGIEMSKYILVWLVPIYVATSLSQPYTFTSAHPRARRWFIAGIALGNLWLAWLFFAWAVPFLRPNHYILAVLCLAVALVPLFLGAADIRRMRPNNSFKPNPLRGSA
jgi:hypothetical protein